MFSVTTPTQICNSPLNRSVSKVQWSFSKASRFACPKPYSKSLGFDPKSTLSIRKASIGYGNRSAYFEGRTDTVDPTTYNMGSSFKNLKNKGYNFGYNRNELNFDNYLNFYEKTPGPAKYLVNQTQIRGKKQYSLRPKTDYPKQYFIPSNPEKVRKAEEPGPGKYDSNDIFGARYYLSNSRNNFPKSFIRDRRFSAIKGGPGPADYPVKTCQATGHSFLSTMRESGSIAKQRDKRVLRMDGNRETPGPGTYRQPSEFGHYERPFSARS